jgi:hypothetical protein
MFPKLLVFNLSADCFKNVSLEQGACLATPTKYGHSMNQSACIKKNCRIPTAAAMAAIFMATLCHCSADTFTTTPISDAFVATGPTGNLSGDNFGAAGALAVAAADLPQGQFQTVIQFNLLGAENAFNAEYGVGQWSIQSVALDLTASPHPNSIFNTPAAGMFGISLMMNNAWAEGTGNGGTPTTDGISFNSLENTYINSSVDQGLGTFSFAGGTSGQSSYTLGLASGLLSGLQDGGDVSLRLYPDDNNISYLFSSRMAGSGGPELVITAVPEPSALLLMATSVFALCSLRFVLKCRSV